jgi:EAL and modified HD-GYP domain-containing signal transduction protein
MVLADLSPDKPAELVKMSAARGWFCEAIAMATGRAGTAHELFLLGLFSLIDAIMDQPLPDILEKLPLPEDVHRTLLGQPTPNQTVRALKLACEQADWDTMEQSAKEIGLTPDQVARTYRESLAWARTALG